MDKKGTNPLISIIVPVYNIQKYLDRCIESIKNQSYQRIQIILVNDGSEDDSGKICDKYAQKDKRIIVVHKKNGGLVSARKVGCLLAKGEYIFYVDGDDWIEKNRILHAVQFLQKTKLDMLYLDGIKKDFENFQIEFKSYNSAGKYRNKDEVFNSIVDIQKFFSRKIALSLCCFCIKASILKKIQIKIDDKIQKGEDGACLFLCILEASAIGYLPDNSYHYIQRPSSICYSFNSKDEIGLKCMYNQLSSLFEKSIDAHKYFKHFILFFYFLMFSCNYKSLLCPADTYLFPFVNVQVKSRIVIYGAGKFGYNMIKALSGNNNYSIVAWVDQDTNRSGFMGYEVTPVSHLFEIDYDFIVIAVLAASDVAVIRSQLIACGIRREKIQSIEQELLTEDRLKKVFS